MARITGGATPSRESPAAENAHEPSPAANKVGCSVDLLTVILLLLPVKSLIRFKCVSKNWLSLISEFHFARDHFRRNPGPSISGIYFKSNYGLKSVSLRGERNLPSLSFIDVLGRQKNTTRIADSCNGLLLCKNLDMYANDSVTQYIVCNVSMQKYKILPKPSGIFKWNRVFLAFDPSKSTHYKVVLVSYNPRPPYEGHVFCVFCSQWNCWKQIFALHTCDGPCFYWNGAIHWVRDGTLKFDVDAEKMIAIQNPPPPKLLSPDKIRYLGGCGGRLFLIQCSSRKVLGFRMLTLSNNCWGSYQVNFRPIISAFPEIATTFEFDVLSLLCDGNGEKKEDFTLVLAIPGRIISYNLCWKTFDVLCDLSEGESVLHGLNCYAYAYAYPVVETLSPV